MSNNNKDDSLPLFNRDELATEAGYMNVMFRLHDIKRECIMPARVEEYKRDTRLAKVTPLIKKFKETKDGKVFWDRDTYEEIPVVFPFGGGFSIDFPLNEGDQGYLVAIDRPWTELYKKVQEKGEEWDKKTSEPDDNGLASFAHGIFIPSSYGKILIDKENDGDLVIARVGKDGKIDGRIALGDRYLDIDLDTTIHGVLTVTNDKRKAVIDANDLDQSDAKFREIMVVTGVEKKQDDKLGLVIEKRRVLADEYSSKEEIEVEVGGGGGGGGKTLTLTYGEDDPVEYNGSQDAEFEVPEPGDGTLTLKIDGTSVTTFSANQTGNKTFNVDIPSVGNGTLSISMDGEQAGVFTANQSGDTAMSLESKVKSVDVKSGTEGLSVSPTTGDVRIENTGVTEVNLDQSNAHAIELSDSKGSEENPYKSKVTITSPILQFIPETYTSDKIADAVSVDLESKGTSPKQYNEVTLGLDKSKANCSIKVNGTEKAKFFGTADVDVEAITNVKSGGNGISVDVSEGEATIRNTGVTSITGSDNVSVSPTTGDVTISVSKPDWNATSGSPSEILNKPNIPSFPSGMGAKTFRFQKYSTEGPGDRSISVYASEGRVIYEALPRRLIKINGVYHEANLQLISGADDDIQSNVQSDWNATSGNSAILNRPTLSTVATSGDYNDLLNRPNIAIQISGDAPSSISESSANLIISCIRYDPATHQIQAKARSLGIENNKLVSISPQSGWIMIPGGQCVTHPEEE